MKLNFLVEGQTEETFVNNVLRPHLENHSINTKVRCLLTSRKSDYEYRGGLNSYEQARNDIRRWLNEELESDTRFTTMFDLYRIPEDFPEYQNTTTVTDPYEKVRILESAFGSDLCDSRLLPYIQLHEFETLVLSDARKLEIQFPNYPAEISAIIEMTSTFSSPELIDDKDGPCDRIVTRIPEYEFMKASAGPIVVAHVGLSTLRKKCTHFGSWINALESLAQQ